MPKLYDHQRDGVKRAVEVLQKTRGYYLIWDPGLGKTLAAILIARLLECERVLVVSPVVAVGVWTAEIRKWWPEADVLVLRDDKWDFAQMTAPRFLVTNYEQVAGRGNAAKRLKLLLKMNYDLLILDEAHYIKSPTSKRTRTMYKLAANSRYRLLLSGTPAHIPLDWWSQFRIVAPHEMMWKQKFSDYRNLVAHMGGPTGSWVVGYRPSVVDTATAAVRSYSHAVKSDVLKLPKPIITVVPVEMSPEERRAYAQMERDLVVELKGEEVMNAQIVLTKMLRLQQITSGALGDREINSTKLRACRELIENRPRQKIVVACKFRQEIDAIKKEMGVIQRPVRVINGDVSPEDRKAIEQEFQTRGDLAIVLLLQYKAGGMALTLTAADALILYSLEFSYIAYQQMVGRVYRIGTTTHVQILPLLAAGTIDEIVYQALIDKADTVDLAKLLLKSVRKDAKQP